MNDEVLELLNKDHLCTFYILPLVGKNVNKDAFKDNFINSYLCMDNHRIYVEVKDFNNLCPKTNLVGVIQQDGRNFCMYNIPEMFKKDLALFKKGQYSKLSPEAKKIIHEDSGLSKIELINDVLIDIRLLALDPRNKILRKAWESYLKTQLEEDAELLSIPNEKMFVSI